MLDNNITGKEFIKYTVSDYPPKLKDPFHDSDSSLESSSSSYPTKYSSSSDWKINSESDSSVSIKKKRSTKKNTKHDTIKKQYFAQIQKKIKKTRKNKASGKKNPYVLIMDQK